MLEWPLSRSSFCSTWPAGRLRGCGYYGGWNAFTLVVIISLVAVLAGQACAQSVPTSINYQGRLTDSTGQLVADGEYTVQFRFYTGETRGTAFSTTTPVKVVATDGLFTTVIQLDASTLRQKPQVWLEVLVGDPPTPLSPRIRLLSVPYALRSAELDLPFRVAQSHSGPLFQLLNTGTGATVYSRLITRPVQRPPLLVEPTVRAMLLGL